MTAGTRAKAGQPQTAPRVSLSDLLDLWTKEHRLAGGSEKTVRDFAHKLDSLGAYLGHDDAEAATQRQIIDWCDYLRAEAKLSAKTVGDKYLTAVKAIYRIGVEKGRIPASPTDGVRVRKPKQIKTRPSGFTDEEARAILLAALQDPSTLGNMAEKNKLAIRWTPWLGAYTGARINELTQLRKQDFITEAGISCVRITPEAGSVKTGQYRVVPLHPHLIEMGLLEFVAAQRGEYLFLTPAETLEATSRRAENVGKKVSEWVRTGAGVTDTGVKPTHGWRHRFKTLARDVDIPDRLADAIQGHSDGSAAAGYGENTVKALYREIQKLPKYEWQ